MSWGSTTWGQGGLSGSTGDADRQKTPQGTHHNQCIAGHYDAQCSGCQRDRSNSAWGSGWGSSSGGANKGGSGSSWMGIGSAYSGKSKKKTGMWG